MGFSRDDAGKFLGAYYDAKIFESDPFAKLDQTGVGKLMKMAMELGRPSSQNDTVKMKELIKHIEKKYKAKPEYLWKSYPEYAVFRHSDNNKWFALMATVDRKKLSLAGDGDIDVINLKVDDLMYRDMLIREDGIMPAYHMNKQHWITVLLDGKIWIYLQTVMNLGGMNFGMLFLWMRHTCFGVKETRIMITSLNILN